MNQETLLKTIKQNKNISILIKNNKNLIAIPNNFYYRSTEGLNLTSGYKAHNERELKTSNKIKSYSVFKSIYRFLKNNAIILFNGDCIKFKIMDGPYIRELKIKTRC